LRLLMDCPTPLELMSSRLCIYCFRPVFFCASQPTWSPGLVPSGPHFFRCFDRQITRTSLCFYFFAPHPLPLNMSHVGQNCFCKLHSATVLTTLALLPSPPFRVCERYPQRPQGSPPRPVILFLRFPPCPVLLNPP